MIRMFLAFVISMVLVLLIGPRMIRKLREKHFGQTIYELGPEQHMKKQGTPVMGGLMMAVGIIVAVLICHPPEWEGIWDYTIPLLGAAFLSMAIGFADDFIKVAKKRHEGLKPWQKVVGQLFVGLAFSMYCYNHPLIGSRIMIPFLNTEWDLGVFYIPVMTLFMVFIVNSSNLQDGLDGLLASVSTVSSSAWAIIVFITVVGIGRGTEAADTYMTIGVFAMAMVGASVGFLRFNVNPAKIFMGDTGSMMLGGANFAVALVLRQPLLLLLVYFMPVLSSISVILQRFYFKLSHGKRLFKMSPLHHHFEKCGYNEMQIVFMYSGLTLLLSLVAILSL